MTTPSEVHTPLDYAVHDERMKGDAYRDGYMFGCYVTREERDKLLERVRDMEWRPIHTAPFDRSDILVAAGKAVYIARWTDNQAREDDRFAWRTDCDVDGLWHGEVTPTHWMPIPPSPALKAE